MNHQITSYAKINFGLKVLFRYPDGYHHIHSLFLPIDFFDTIESLSTHSATNDEVKKPTIQWVSHLNTYYSELLAPYFSGDLVDKNILMKSFYWFLSMLEHKLVPQKIMTQEERLLAVQKISSLKLTITKSIPSPAGLGGGSSNAAALIKCLVREAFGDSLPKYHHVLDQLQKESIELGADIPFFFLNQPAIVTGIGQVTEKCSFPPVSGILGIPPLGFPTKLVYQALNSPLQNKKQSDANLNLSIDPFRRLASYVCEQEKNEVSALPVSALPAELTHEEEDGIVYIKNDLLDATGRVNRDQNNYMRSLMKQLARTIGKKGSSKQKTYYSMSGSGGSFFAIKGGLLKTQLNAICDTFKERYPEVQWRVFSILSY